MKQKPVEYLHSYLLGSHNNSIKRFEALVIDSTAESKELIIIIVLIF